EWERVFRLAEGHRVLPPVAHRLSGREDVPGSIQSALRARFQRNSLKALRFCAELARITQAFTGAGIEVLAHKGPVLSEVLYGDPAIRQFGDLDLLVRPGHVAAAKRVLSQLGYEPQLRLTPRREEAYLQTGYEYVFRLGDQRNLLELQWRFLPGVFSVCFAVEEVFLRGGLIFIERFPVRGPGHKEFIVVCFALAIERGSCVIVRL